MRTFESGATRDSDQEKLDYEAFNSPLVDRRYAEYMHAHRKQADGTLRPGDNWQLGIPEDVYMKSLCRHVTELRLIHDGWDPEGDMEDKLCAIIFNAKGRLFEILAKKHRMKHPER